MATVFKVKEADARSILEQADIKVGKSDDGDALVKKLKGLIKKIEDDEEEPDLDKASLKKLRAISEALEEKKKIVIESAEADDEDEEEEEEEKPAKKGTKKSSRKKAAEASRNGELSNKTQQGHILNGILAKGPISEEDLYAKASKKIDISERRVAGHVKWMIEKGRAAKKKGKIQLVDKE